MSISISKLCNFIVRERRYKCNVSKGMIHAMISEERSVMNKPGVLRPHSFLELLVERGIRETWETLKKPGYGSATGQK
jgi:hypothetical protein